MSQTAAGESVGPVPLEYAPDPRRQRWQRRGVWALIAFTIVMAAWFVYANRAEISFRYRRWQLAKLCLAHVTPPGTKLVVYDNIRALLASNPDYMIDADPTIFSKVQPLRVSIPLRLVAPPAGYMPTIWKEYAALDPRTAIFNPIPFRQPSPMNFLGERYTPSGKRRLVAIAGELVNAYGIEDEISSLVLSVPGILDPVDPPSPLQQALQRTGQFRAAYLEPAVADTNDRTHLTIDFTIPPHSHGQPQRKGVLDVYVQDNDTLVFKVRDPATTQGL